MNATLKTKVIWINAAIACPVFMITVLIEGALRPGYQSLLYPLSSLSIGDTGWIQIANFIYIGLSIVLFSWGLKKITGEYTEKFKGPVLIRLVGIGMIGAGIFSTDPIFGYPTDQPMVLRQFTIHGHLHDAFSMLVFICMPWACFVFKKYFTVNGQHIWAQYSVYTAYGIIVAFILASMGFKQLTGFVSYAGLFQRICVSLGLAWLTSISIYLYKLDKKNYDRLINI
jgi:hypothetical protein